jgi:hypothetical protein
MVPNIKYIVAADFQRVFPSWSLGADWAIGHPHRTAVKILQRAQRYSIKDTLLSKSPMKLANLNINDINRRLMNLLNWLRRAKPDIVCLQELKATDVDFPAEAIQEAGYHCSMGRRETLEWRSVTENRFSMLKR